MQPEPVTFRRARPVIEEGMRFARLEDIAADGLFRTLLGPKSKMIIANAYLEPGHDLSHQSVLFAEVEGEIAGMVASYSWEQHARSSGKPLMRAAGIRALRMIALMPFAARFGRFVSTVPEGVYYVESVAVEDRHRGLGIGSLLLDQAEEMARANGCTRLALDVSETNLDARRLYERRGMTAEATSPPILFIPKSRVHRMVKTL